MATSSDKDKHPDASDKAASGRTDFIRHIINEDRANNKHQGRVATRFPPEPNGYLHIGHAKSICLNFGLAKDYRGTCNLRFDDTNPIAEDVKYVNSIMADVRWLGFDWQDRLFHASDYFDRLYELAVGLIEQEKAYVCSLSEEDIRTYRGTVTEPGKPSPFRDRSAAENLDLFARMRAGEFPDGAHVLRAKIDMAAANMKMRDPLLYRIRHAHHQRTGDAWPIYPMYDFAHCLSDAIEGITHSICTLEFENNRELYDWIVREVGAFPDPPQQIEFARLNLNYTVMSKRKLLTLVEEGHVSGWDDPRLSTIAGLRRRGYTPESIRNFCASIGVAKANSVVDIAQLEHHVRDDLNHKAPRVLAVLKPLMVVIENYPEDHVEWLDADYFPHDVPKEGSRDLPFSREIYIERDDFQENPPKGFHRLSPGVEVRLRHAYFLKCERVVKDPDSGEVVELRCSYDPESRGAGAPASRKVKGTIHWVSAAHAIRSEVRLYDRLFLEPNPGAGKDSGDFKEALNPESLLVLEDCMVEPVLGDAQTGDMFQFERQGYFCVDADTKHGAPVFNRTVALRDSWGKGSEKEQPSENAASVKPKQAAPKKTAPPQAEPKKIELTDAAQARADHYHETCDLSENDAALLARDPKLGGFFDQALTAHNNPKGIANWVLNEMPREHKENGLDDLAFSAKDLADLVALLDEGVINGKIAKTVFAEMLKNGGNPREIVEAEGLRQVTDSSELAPLVEALLARHGDEVARFREGEQKLMGFFVGLVMKETRGQANPKLVNQILREKLG